MKSTDRDKEMLRHATLEVLVACFPVPRLTSGVRRIVCREVPFDVSEEDVEAALEFHREAGNVGFAFDDQGSSKWWKATQKGVLRIERGPAPQPGHD